MNHHHRINKYLDSVKDNLASLDIQKREEIILDLKRKIDNTLNLHPNSKLAEILNSLGHPSLMANLLMIQNGKLPANKLNSKSSFKQLIIFILILTAISIGIVAALIWKFTPLMEVSKLDNKVSFLGGSIVLEDQEKIDSNSTSFNGTQTLDPANIDSSFILFSNANFIINTSASNELSWKCKTDGTDGANTLPIIKNESKSFHLDFSNQDYTDCTIEVPKNLKLTMNGHNGTIKFNKINFPAHTTLDNGRIIFTVDPKTKYTFDISVANGRTDDFSNYQSSDKSSAYKIFIDLSNGSVEVE